METVDAWTSFFPATSEEDVVGCNETDAATLFTLDYWYMKEGARTNHLACSGNNWIEVWLAGSFIFIT